MLGRTMSNIEQVVFVSCLDARGVLEKMKNLIQGYGQVTLNDYYHLCGHKCDSAYNNYGWRNLEYAVISKMGNGYVINMPFPTELDPDYEEYESQTPVNGAPIVLTISRVDLLSKQYIKEEYIDQVGKVACVCGIYKTLRSVKVTEQEVILELY